MPSRVVWRYEVRPLANEPVRPLRGRPLRDSEGRLFVAIQNRLVMFRTGEQQPAWSYAVGGAIPRSPAIGPDGVLRVHAADGYLHFIDSTGNATCAPAAVGPPLGWSSPVIDAENRTWICRSEGGIVRVDGTGQVESKPFVRTRRRFDCTGVIARGHFYIGCEDHSVHAYPLDGRTGENAWAAAPGQARTGCAINCELVLAPNGELLVASQDDQLYAWNADGSLSWSLPLPGHVLGAPASFADGTLVLGISVNQPGRPPVGWIVGVDRTAHRIKWQLEAAAPVESTPVVGDADLAYLGDNGGGIYAVDAQGRIVWRDKVDSPVRSIGAIVAPGQFAFGLDDGSFAVFDG